MDKLKIMISSTIEDLEAERDAVEKVFRKYDNIVELIGAGNLNNIAQSSSSHYQTLEFAENCDLYILILGSRYGFELPNKKSATEIEYDKALIDDPTKILIFKKSIDNIEEKQKSFINKVSDYSNGYWRTPFNYTHELSEMVENSFLNWLYNRTKRKDYLSNVDRFIQLAISKKTKNIKEFSYKVSENHIELNYKINGFLRSKHIQITQINTKFWETFSDLINSIDEWTYEI